MIEENLVYATLGYLLGPNVVTIHAADFCTVGCQENYPDEYCSQYPPEGIPAKPRTVDDWGTKFNITADMIKRGQMIYLHIIFSMRAEGNN